MVNSINVSTVAFKYLQNKSENIAISYFCAILSDQLHFQTKGYPALKIIVTSLAESCLTVGISTLHTHRYPQQKACCLGKVTPAHPPRALDTL